MIHKRILRAIHKKTKNMHKVGKAHFSFINNRLNRMRYPLYFYLIAGNTLIYFAWNSGIISKTFLNKHFFLSSNNVGSGRLHTLYTYTFAHTNFFHLLMNGAGLYFVGRAVEGYFGPRILLNLHVVGALAGGLYALITKNKYDNRSIVGASASLSAVLAFFIMNFPKEQFLVFPFPFPIRAWVLGGGYMLYSFMNSGNQYSMVSHSGHFGGFMAGVAYYFFLRGGLR